MMENRSFDNLFGRFPGVNGTTVGVKSGEEVPLIKCPDWLPGDLPHDRAAALNCLNGGKLDGFAGGEYGDPWSYSQFQEHQLPNYWHWAKEYALSDNFYASALGPSYPNHFFFIAGQSGGVIDNPENILTRPGKDGEKPFKSWGCDALGDDVFVLVKDGKGNLSKHDSCFNFKTVGQQLTEIGVDWRYYSAVPGQVGLLLERVQRDPGRLPHRSVARARAEPRRPTDRRHRGERAPGGHVGHAAVRAVRSPAGELVVRAQLADRHRERRDEERDVGPDGDLHHVGRVGRVLRQRDASRGRRGRPRVPRPAVDDLAVHATRA